MLPLQLWHDTTLSDVSRICIHDCVHCRIIDLFAIVLSYTAVQIGRHLAVTCQATI